MTFITDARMAGAHVFNDMPAAQSYRDAIGTCLVAAVKQEGSPTRGRVRESSIRTSGAAR